MSDVLIYRRESKVLHHDGLHVRPLSQINRLACTCDGAVTIQREEFLADAKSMFDLLQLNASHGTMLIIEAHGNLAQQVVDDIARLISEPPPPAEDASRSTQVG
jgi:phosphotransferase system HPr (HPr) family protein